MSRRTKVTGTRSFTLWLLIFIAVVLAVGVAAGALFLLPQIKAKQDLEKHYQAGVAFQNVGDWSAAEAEFKQVVALDAKYKDVQTLLAEVRAALAESAATATAVAIAQAEHARLDAQATATARAQATVEAQANAEATAAAAPTATAEALEAHYQKGLGYMNMGRWEQAKAELEQVFEANPNYKEVQAKLATVETEAAKLTPTPTPIPVATPTPPHTPTPAVVRPSSFDGTNTEGWTTNEGPLTNPGTGGSGGGPNNGCLIWTEGGSGTSYYVASSKYHGDWRSYSELKLDLWSSGGKYFTSGQGMHGDIFLASGYATAQRLLSHRPPDQWETFIIPLKDEDEWAFGGGATSLDDVLVNVTDFQIRAEYGEGVDKSGLDNVELVR